ncbi:hypothetical protein ABEY43_06845 [Priestia megaterium]
MKLKFSGIEYGYGCTNTIESVIDTDKSFSIEHEGDMTVVYNNEGSWNTFRRKGFKCEIVSS